MNDPNDTTTEGTTQRAPLITDVENRLQFNTFVSIFFGTLLYTFSRSLDKPEADASKLLMHWASLPVLYVMSYSIFEAGRRLVPVWCLKLIGGLLLLNAMLFVLPMGIIAAIDAKWPRIELLFGAYSFPLIPTMTMLLFLVIVGDVAAGALSRGQEWLHSSRQSPADAAAEK